VWLFSPCFKSCIHHIITKFSPTIGKKKKEKKKKKNLDQTKKDKVPHRNPEMKKMPDRTDNYLILCL